MSRRLDHRLTKLELAYGGMDTWSRVVEDWIWWVERSPYPMWLFFTETTRPSPLELPLMDLGSRYAELVAGWRETREDAWGAIFWSSKWIVTPEGGHCVHVRGEAEPVVPSLEQSAEDFSLLLATIPPPTFQWSKAFTRDHWRYEVLLQGEKKRKWRYASYFATCEREAISSAKANGWLMTAQFEEVIRLRRPELTIGRTPE